MHQGVGLFRNARLFIIILFVGAIFGGFVRNLGGVFKKFVQKKVCAHYFPSKKNKLRKWGPQNEFPGVPGPRFPVEILKKP